MQLQPELRQHFQENNESSGGQKDKRIDLERRTPRSQRDAENKMRERQEKIHQSNLPYQSYNIQQKATTMCLHSTKKAGHDIVTIRNENKTHIETNTCRIHAKTCGFRLFDIHAEGSETSGTGMLTHPGLFGIMGKILLVVLFIVATLWVAKRIMAYRVRHDSYKVFYRNQGADSPFALATPATTGPALEFYGPNNKRNPVEALNQLHYEVKELKQARRKMEAHLTATGQASVAAPPAAAPLAGPSGLYKGKGQGKSSQPKDSEDE